MHQISSLEKRTSGRYKVLLEDGEFFLLYGKELGSFGIEEQGMLSDTDYAAIMQEILPKRAKLYAMHLLEKMDRTESQLRRKLEQAEYPPQIVDCAVAYVKQYRYVDDLRYAVSYMEYRKDSKSKMQLQRELCQKGISKEVFTEAMEQIELPQEDQQIMDWVRKKRYVRENAEPKETEKLFRFLLRKGYDIGAIKRVLRADNLYD